MLDNIENRFFIDGFLSGKLFLNTDFLISKEVFEDSNALFVDEHVKDIWDYVIKPKLKKSNIDIEKLTNDLILVIAHGKSDKEKWLIFGEKSDNEGIKIEDFLDKLLQDKKILLYVCNSGGYKIENGNYKIIYPKTNTGVENLEFYIQGELLELFS